MIQTGKNQEKDQKKLRPHVDKNHEEAREVLQRLGEKNKGHEKFSPGQSPDYNPEDYNTD